MPKEMQLDILFLMNAKVHLITKLAVTTKLGQFCTHAQTAHGQSPNANNSKRKE